MFEICGMILDDFLIASNILSEDYSISSSSRLLLDATHASVKSFVMGFPQKKSNLSEVYESMLLHYIKKEQSLFKLIIGRCKVITLKRLKDYVINEIVCFPGKSSRAR